MTIDWELRYRSPLSPSKGVDDVLVQTDAREGESVDAAYKRAKVVADYWLGTARAHPNTTFIYLRPAVVMSERRMAQEIADAGAQHAAFLAPDVQAPSSGDAERPVTATAVPGEVIRQGQAGESGPAVPSDIPLTGASSSRTRSRVGQ